MSEPLTPNEMAIYVVPLAKVQTPCPFYVSSLTCQPQNVAADKRCTDISVLLNEPKCKEQGYSNHSPGASQSRGKFDWKLFSISLSNFV